MRQPKRKADKQAQKVGMKRQPVAIQRTIIPYSADALSLLDMLETIALENKLQYVSDKKRTA